MDNASTVNLLISDIEQKLALFKEDFTGLSWREKVLRLIDVLKAFKDLGVNTDPRLVKIAARERIRLYLIHHVRTVILAEELQVVSGISEYGRRIRELRVQDGYKILTGYSNDPEAGVTLGARDYYLVDMEPDKLAAHRWHIANRIRNEPEGGSSARLLKYFTANVGQIVTSEELSYVAKASEFGRRIRELRTEEGYAISTCLTGRPDLKMGEYILESSERIAEPHDRKIPFSVQKEVYERAANACQLCDWSHEKWSKDDPRILELHHIIQHSSGGQNSPENLVVLCSRCHDDVHANRRELPPNILE